MKYLTVYSDLLSHKKTISLTSMLKIERSIALGIVVSLWCSVAKNSPSGDTNIYDIDTWAKMSCWPILKPKRTSNQRIWKALIECGQDNNGEYHHGFIEDSGIIHDWDKIQRYAQRLNADSNRKRRQRNPQDDSVSPNDINNVTGHVTGQKEKLSRDMSRGVKRSKVKVNIKEKEKEKNIKAKDIFDFYCETLKKSTARPPFAAYPGEYESYRAKCATRAAFFNRYPNEYPKFKKSIELMVNHKDQLEWHDRTVKITWFINNNTNYIDTLQWFEDAGYTGANNLSEEEIKKAEIRKRANRVFAEYAKKYPDRVNSDSAGKLEPIDTFKFRHKENNPDYIEELREMFKASK